MSKSPMTPKIGVILFPGTNCELEALRACKRSRMQPELFRWNDPDRKKLKKYDGYIIPGGFSYEDRGRSGVVASKDPIMEIIKTEAAKGKPLLGICNGAQILVEIGLIPGLNIEHLEMALAWNERIRKRKILGVGFYNDWIHVRSDARPGRSAYNRFSQKVVMRIPVAHGEGRFTTRETGLLQSLIKNEQTLFRYCDADGKISPEFPINPNGALYNLAGVCNIEGNVMALMPHPERTINGQPIFDSLADYLASPRKTPRRTAPAGKTSGIQKPRLIQEKIEKLPQKPDIAISVELIITDNEERTIESAIKKIGYKDVKLKRKIYFGFYTRQKSGLKQLTEKLIKTGEILNLNKETPTITIGNSVYGYDKTQGLIEKTASGPEGINFFTSDYDNYSGKNLQTKLQQYFKNNEVTEVVRGIQWTISLKKPEQLQNLIQTHILHNPHSMKIVAI